MAHKVHISETLQNVRFKYHFSKQWSVGKRDVLTKYGGKNGGRSKAIFRARNRGDENCIEWGHRIFLHWSYNFPVPADAVTWVSQLFWQGSQKACFGPLNCQTDKIHTLIKPKNSFKTLRYIFIYLFIIFAISPHLTSWRSTLILSSHLHLGFPSGLLPSGFPTKTLIKSCINKADIWYLLFFYRRSG